MTTAMPSAACPVPTVPDGHYVPDINPQFPRTEYKRLASYSDPLMRPHSRVLWAARDASTEWARAFAKQDWDAIDEATVRLVVFDKAYEINQAQWPLRGSQHPREWRTETNEYLTISFLLAVLALQGAGQHSRVPLRSRVLAFCRAALDLCAEPVVDAGPSHLLLLDDDHKPPPPASRGDRIGRLLAQYDPAVRHAAFLAKPMPRDTAAFVHDPQRREYVLSEHPDLPDLTHGVSDRSSLACESARGDAAPPPTVVPALAGQDMQTP